MGKERLDSYKGKLNYKQITDGINAAKRNAKRLAEDAELLLKNKRYPGAVSLAILSIEETGKEHILREMSTKTDEKEIRKIWNRYRRHLDKNVLWAFPHLYIEGARKLEDFRDIFKPDAETSYTIEQVKQISIYSDCLGNANWSEPENLIDENLAISIVEIAKLFIKSKKMEYKEIELWIKHMQPVEGKSHTEKKIALLRWFKEMHDLGLRPKGEKLADVMRFLGIKFKNE